MSSSASSYPFTFRYPAPWDGDDGRTSLDGLCAQCTELDLEQSFRNAFDFYEQVRRGNVSRIHDSFRRDDGPVYLRDYYFVTSLGNRLSQPGDCKLCLFFASMVRWPMRGTYKILAFCSSESYLFEPRKKDVRGRIIRRPWEVARPRSGKQQDLMDALEHNVFMALVPEMTGIPRTGVPVRWFETDLPRNGSLYRFTAAEEAIKRLVLPRKLGPQANFGLLRAWLCYCRCHHSSCGRRKAEDANLSGFRVIDCREKPPRVVTRSWSGRYVALSYVWGPPSGDWPQTVLDAVEVTKQMGERYLWVDRTCIDQYNKEEKNLLISKMDAIYNGAEFTIVCAAGDARTGLPGVRTTPRKPQPWVELSQRSERSREKSAVRFRQESVGNLLGVSDEEYDTDTAGEYGWLDDLRFGLRGRMTFDFGELMRDEELKKKYDISSDHLHWYQEVAEDDGWDRTEDYLDLQKELAHRMRMPLRDLLPHIKQEAAKKLGWGLDPSELDRLPVGQQPMVSSSKPRRPLPANKPKGRLTLVSTMQEPRTVIRESEWATRGWTYQEGVLSNRRLVFTSEQVYWECRGMAVCETTDISLDAVQDLSETRMASYMLSGIFEDDLHENSELQYGFQQPTLHNTGDKVVVLDGHIQAFTSRKLTDSSDSLKAFMGVAAAYRTEAGLCLLLGLPVWSEAFANDKSGLQDTFALSLSSWTHIAEPTYLNSDIFIADCSRRNRFPSWTWAGWEGSIQFCNEKQSVTHQAEASNGLLGVITTLPGSRATGQDSDFETATDPSHSDFFKALTSKEWIGGMKNIWSAEMALHNIEGTHFALADWTPIETFDDVSMTWLLTIRKPLVLSHMQLVHSLVDGKRLKVSERTARVHLSIPITEAQLQADHNSGHLVSVLVFASTVPYVYNGIARYLIMRRADEAGHWERIGRLNMWLTETELKTLDTPEAMLSALPVKPFGEDITIV